MLLEDCSNSLRGDKCIHSLSRSNRGMKSGHRKERGRGEEEKGERERETENVKGHGVGVGSRGYSPDRAFPGTRTWPVPEDDQYELCELLHPAGTTYRPCSTVRTHPSPSERDETDGDERPPPLLARVRRLLRTRAPLLPPRVSRSPPPANLLLFFRSRYRWILADLWPWTTQKARRDYEGERVLI